MRNVTEADLLAAEAALAMRSPLDMGLYVNRRDRWDPASSAFKSYTYARLLSDTILRFVEHPTAKYLLLSGPVRHGKLVAHDEPVFTPQGWTVHGKLRPGDEVFGPDGTATRVVALGPDAEASIEVEVSDGARVLVHPDHEWKVWDRGGNGSWRVVETRDLKPFSGGRAQHLLPETQALQMPERSLPVDPYTLGAWLGDGRTSAADICGAVEDLAHICRRIPYQRGWATVHKTTGVGYQGFLGLRTGLRKAGVLGLKHVPEEYQLSSEAQRRQLLSGLVDTDGSVGSDGRVRFVTVSERLATDVQQLVRSLGYRANRAVRPADARQGRAIKGRQPVWVVDWTPTDGLGQGTLPRKVRPLIGRRKPRSIRAVRQVPAVPGRCIQVARPDGMYLVGESLVPTHNSWVVSRTVPTWFLARYPDRQLIMAGYGADFSSTWGRLTRDQIADHPELGIGIDQSARSVEHFALAKPHRGSATFTGVGGSITGKGAHLFIIDDPTKTAEEAMSATYQQKLEDWYWGVADTRLEPGGKMIVMQARWAFADTYGRLAERLQRDRPGETWRIETPALADGNPWDPTGREIGEALVPERYPVEELEAIKATTDPWAWSALYQCSPQSESGGLFAKSGRRTYTTTPEHYVLQQPDSPPVFIDRTKTRRFVTADLAASTRTMADFTVFSVWEAALLPDTQLPVLLLTGVVRSRIDSADHLTQAVGVFRRFRPLFIGVERATYGLTLLTQLQRERVPVRELLPDKDKVSRALPASSAWNAGRVFLPAKEEMAIVDELADEASQFPNGRHDDWTDTLSYAVLELDTGPIGASLGAYRPRKAAPEPGTADWLLQGRFKKDRRVPRTVGL